MRYYVDASNSADLQSIDPAESYTGIWALDTMYLGIPGTVRECAWNVVTSYLESE